MDFLDDHSAEKGDICDECLSGFDRLSHPFCTICGVPFKSKVEEDHLCEKCLRKRPYYDLLRAPYLYEDKIMDAVHLIKYSGKSTILKTLGPLLGAFVKDLIGDTKDMVLIPVPLHKKKLKQRGFNQSVLIAKAVSAFIGAEPELYTLTRIKYTESQTGLSLEQRRKNVKGAFEVRGDKVIHGKTVILVDDVATTGNTVNECARMLKKAGSKKVYGLVLARTAAY